MDLEHLEAGPAAECRAILWHAAGDEDQARQQLMLADYASRARALGNAERAPLDRLAVELGTRQRSLVRSELYEISTEMAASATRCDVAVLGVIEVEADALRTVFGEEDVKQGDSGREYRLTTLKPPARRELRLVYGAVGESKNHPIRSAIDEVRGLFAPRTYILVGIAAGVRGRVKKYTVVLPNRVVYYEPGSVLSGGILKRRDDEEPVPQRGVQAAVQYRPERFGEILAEACASVGAEALSREFDATRFALRLEQRDRQILSGEKLDRSDLESLRDLIEADERIVALDQESYGFSQGAGEPWLIVRSISDHGRRGAKKEQLVAALAAASVAKDLLERGASLALLEDG